MYSSVCYQPKQRTFITVEGEGLGEQPSVGFVSDIHLIALANPYYRRVVKTTEDTQTVVMALDPGDDIGLEFHADTEQFIRIERGDAVVRVGDGVFTCKEGAMLYVPRGAIHNVVNASTTEDLKLSTIYVGKVLHPAGIVEIWKAPE